MTAVARRAFLGGTFALLAGASASRAMAAWDLTAIPDPTAEAMVPVPGGRVYVRVNGDLSSGVPPMVCVHGGPGGTGISFYRFLSMAGERPIILYDQLDSGRSDRPGNPANWNVARFVDELEAIRTHFRIPRWHVYGGSWGGTIALENAARRLPGLASTILQSPLVSTKSWIADADALRRDLPADVQQALRDCDPPRPLTPACETATETFYANFLTRRPSSALLKAYHERFPAYGYNDALYNAMWGSSEFVATGTLKTYDGEPLLDRIDGARTLFVTGQYDEARPVTVGAFARRAKAEFAVVPGAGHAVLNDRPEELIGLVRPWLREHDS